MSYRPFLLCLAVLGTLGLAPFSARAQHFSSCLSNVNNATVIVPDSVVASVGQNSSLESGDEIALFTNDGDCAGYGTWNGANLTIAVAGSDAQTPKGYESSEPLKFRVWDASEGAEYAAGSAKVAYEPCDSNPICRDNEAYQHDVMFSVGELNASDPLPVELTEFEARLDENEAVLEWNTASEVNNAGFEIQHRTSQNEVGTWERLAFVEGHGTTNQPQAYSYRTEELSPGQHTFRLKQIDLDGAFEYSPTVEVTVELAVAHTLSQAYPNPFTQRTQLTLTLAEQQPVRAAVYNALGQRIAVLHDGPLSPNTTHTFTFRSNQLPSGLYFIRVQGESFSTTRRATLVK